MKHQKTKLLTQGYTAKKKKKSRMLRLQNKIKLNGSTVIPGSSWVLESQTQLTEAQHASALISLVHC